MSYQMLCNKRARVSNLIVDGEWPIPDYVRRQIPDLAGHMEEIAIRRGHDEWIWTSSCSGEYTRKHQENKDPSGMAQISVVQEEDT